MPLSAQRAAAPDMRRRVSRREQRPDLRVGKHIRPHMLVVRRKICRVGDEAGGLGAAAVEAVEPPTDIHASSGYRRQITGVLVRRALTTAEGRVKGQA